jgi:hypothetical protein
MFFFGVAGRPFPKEKVLNARSQIFVVRSFRTRAFSSEAVSRFDARSRSTRTSRELSNSQNLLSDEIRNLLITEQSKPRGEEEMAGVKASITRGTQLTLYFHR